MAWYRTGNVAVAASDTVVTGTGTLFATHVRVGDGFVGPDGRMYEVTNVASETVLSIFPPYQGPTATGQDYSIIPVQGYPKRLADRAGVLVDEVGLLPGRMSDAEDTLAGLGTAAGANLQTSPRAQSGVDVLRRGDWGIGSVSPFIDGALNDNVLAQFFAKFNDPNHPGELMSGVSMPYSPDWVVHLLMRHGSIPRAFLKAFHSGTTWTSLYEILSSGNFTFTRTSAGSVLRIAPLGIQICTAYQELACPSGIWAGVPGNYYARYENVGAWPATFASPPLSMGLVFGDGNVAARQAFVSYEYSTINYGSGELYVGVKQQGMPDSGGTFIYQKTAIGVY